MKSFILFLFLAFGLSTYGQRFVKTFNTLDDAYRANLKDVHTNLFVLGRSAVNDGGGGSFFYDGSSSTTTNLGTVFGNVNGGRVMRVYPPSYVEARWFGAKSDGVTDATAAIQSAIDTVGYGTVQLEGTNVVSNLVIKKGIVLRGHNKYNTTLKALSGATGWMISFDDLVSGSQLDTEFNMVPTLVENLSLEGNNRASDIGGIYMNHCDYFNIRSVMIWRFQRSALYLNNSVRESLFDDVSIRFCGKRDATNNDGAGWPAVSFVDRESTTSNAEDKHNGIRFQNSQVVFSLGDALHIDTRQISTGGRKVNNISITDCWIHGWASTFYGVEFSNTLTNSSTLRAYDLVKVGAAYDVRMSNNRFSFAGDGKPSMTLTTSALGGTAISGFTYTPEKVQIVGNFFNHRYTTSIAAENVGVKADSGSGIISDNVSEGLASLYNVTTGWIATSPRTATDEGITFDPNISSSYASGTIQSLGSSAFTVHIKARMPDAIPASAGALVSIGSSIGTTSTPGFAIYLSSNGNLYPILYGSTFSDRRIATIARTAIESLLGQIVDFVFTRSGTTFRVYINGGEYPYVEETAGTAPAWSDSLSSTKWNLGASVGTPWPSTIHEFRVANRVLSSTEVMALSRGTVPADMWGSMTAQSSGLFTVGYKYRIESRASSDFTTIGAANNTVGTEFTATGTGAGLLDASNTVLRLGWIVDPDLVGNSGTTVYDRSTNDGDGSLVGNGVKWIKSVGSASAAASVTPIDQPDRGYSWDGIQASSYIGGLSQQLGTDPFTIHARVRWPASSPTNNAGIFTLTTVAGSFAVNGCGLVLDTSGNLSFFLYGSTGSDFRLALVAPAQLAAFAGVPVNLTITRSGTTLAIYANGTALTYSEATSGSAPAWSSSITTDRYNIGLFTSSQPWVSTISAFRVANRALSATEVAALNRGVGPADVWGSTAILNSGTLTVGKRYRIVARVASDFTTVGSANNTVGTEFVATGTGSGLLDASNTVQRVGWFLDVDLGSNVAGSALDRTSNALNGTVVGAGLVQVPADPVSSGGGGGVATTDSPTWTGAHTFSKNGALSLPTLALTGSPITGGTATTTKPLTLIETAGATSTGWSTSGTLLGVNSASGFAGRTFDFQANGVSTLNLSAAGTLSGIGNWNTAGNIIAGGGLNLSWFGRSEMLSPSDGVILLQNAANSDFTRLQLGGTTTSFPAIERSGTGVAIKLADGSADAPLTASAVTATTFTGALVGNASTAAALQTARNINGVSFNGTADITVPAAAGTLTGSTLAAGVTGSSLTSVGTISSGTWQGTTIALNKGGTGATTASGAFDAIHSAEATVASATTTDLGAVTSDKVSITGTTTITSFGTAAAGVKRQGRFTGALTLTHNATSLIIPGGASLSTAAGDRFGAYSLGSGNWVVTYYTKADGTAVVGGSGSVATDTIWDASGDLVVGTGSNTATRLAPPSYQNSTLFYGPDGVEWVSPASHFILQEDFNINGSLAGRVTSINSGGVMQDANSEAGAYGVWSLSTSSSASSSIYAYVGAGNAMAFGLNRTVITWRNKLSNLSDASQTYTARVGFFDGATVVDGAWFEYSHGVNSGNWQCKVSKASSVTTVNTGTAASTNWDIFTIDANSGGTEVKFYINGTLVHTETGANIPTGTARAMPMYGIAKSAGTTARIFYADYLHMYAKY